MSAFDSLGLAMIPSAYKGEADVNNAGGYLGKVYSVLPEQTISDNLVVNGTFDSDTAWSKGTGWTISGGVASCDGTQTANSPLVQQSTILGANLNIENNKTYRITFDITVSAGFITNIEIGSGYNYNQISTSQIGYTVDFNSGTSGNDRLTITANPDFVGTIDNVSLQLISDGDFQFSRGSDTTRVNSQGYIESIQVLSDNLVTNGDFEQVGNELVANGDFSNGFTNWNYQEGWYADNGVATFDYRTIATTSNSNLWQSPLVIGKVYKLNFDITSYTSGYIRNVNSSISDDDLYNTVGNFTQYFVAAGVNLYLKCSPDAILSIDNVSVKEVGQGWNFANNTIVDDNDNLKVNFYSANSTLYQSNASLLSGRKYRFTYTISNSQNSNSLYLTFAGVDTLLNRENGTHFIDITNTTSTSYIFKTAGTYWVGYIDNISVVEVTDDTDIPRIDYTNAACPSLLLEPTRMNLVLQSEYKSAGDFTNATFSYNSIISPRGVNDATKIIDDSTNGQHRVFIGSFSVTSGLDYTVSAFVKNNDVGFCYILLEGDFSQTRYYFNLSTGEAITSGLKVESFANGWYRIYVTQSAAATGTGTAYLNMAINGTSAIYSGTGQSLYFYGFQAELGSYPTSYIPTNGTQVTRLADVCHNAGDSTVFNDAEGTVYFEGKLSGLSNIRFLSSISDGTQTNFIWLYVNNDNGLLFQFYSGGVIQPSISINNFHANYDMTKNHKIAGKYNSSGCKLYIDGKIVGQNNSPITAPIGLNKLSLDRGDSTYGSFTGDIRSVLYFNTALSDAELEALTSSDITRVLKNYARRGVLLDATYEADYVQSRLNKLF